MIDALIKRVSVTYKCYEMKAHVLRWFMRIKIDRTKISIDLLFPCKQII
jgi:hypothetical protein